MYKLYCFEIGFVFLLDFIFYKILFICFVSKRINLIGLDNIVIDGVVVVDDLIKMCD